jgi:uncharacterized surface anchored protein
MKGLRVAIAFGFFAAAIGIGLSARADTFNKLSYLTFSQPVELPGNVTLPAGTYAFTVMEHFGYRHIVQVFNKDRTQLFATILAIPNYRVETTTNSVLKFSETASGAPNAVKEWFYPGDSFGHEFVYPKNRAVELAEVSHEPVPAMPAELAPEITKQEPAVKEMEQAPLKAEQPSGRETEIAEVFETTPPAGELPQTASFLPLIGLTGLLFITAGTVLWAFSKRSV